MILYEILTERLQPLLMLITQILDAHPVASTATLGLSTAIAVSALRYRGSIQKRLEQIQNSQIFGNDPFRMKRVSACELPVHYDKVRLVALNPDFVAQHQHAWRLVSLGDYMASLRPAVQQSPEKLPEWLETELQATLATALLKGLGPQFGTAVLPALGFGMIQRALGGVSSSIASTITGSQTNPVETAGGVPLSLFALTFVAEANYQRLKKGATESETLKNETTKEAPEPMSKTSPLRLLRDGESGFKPNFVDQKHPETQEPLMPDTFVISRHWKQAIDGMEKIMMADDDENDFQSSQRDLPEGQPPVKKLAYSPESRELPPPTPINERLLPGLHLGYGSAKCTHTHREILENRMLCILLNRLASNYYFDSSEPYKVQLDEDGDEITTPSALVEALMATGHTIETCVVSRVTSFGVGLSVKEDDASWSNIPLGYFVQSGFQDAQGNDAFTLLPHSGLVMTVRGPLMENGNIQHFMGIDGMCAWHSNHDPMVPWIKDIECSPVFCAEDAVRSARVAAMEALIINGVGTKLDLPFGGYGLTSVCNDSAALIEFAMTRKTNIYPITLGRFGMQNYRFAEMLRKKLMNDSSMKREVEELDNLINAMKRIPSDLTTSPGNALDQSQRLLGCQDPAMPFLLMKETRKIVSSIQNEIRS